MCPENLLMHKEDMASLLSDTCTHLPEAPAHPPQHTGVLRASSSLFTQFIHSSELGSLNRTGHRLLLRVSFCMSQQAYLSSGCCGLRTSWGLWGESTSLPFLVSTSCFYPLACSPFLHLQRTSLISVPFSISLSLILARPLRRSLVTRPTSAIHTS